MQQSEPGAGGVAVIIPAYNCADTIGAAIGSALAEPEVAEVVVVDDASSDDSVGAAWAADDGSGRLAVYRLAANGGPARARNVALSHSTAPVVAILDSDDRIVAGRFARLLAVPHWDMIGDNIVFAATAAEAEGAATQLAAADASTATTSLDLATFARGNVPVPGRLRRELGFLHPLMRRDFLDRAGLRYSEAMRLGEDFELYARALLAEARFLVCAAPGYVALQRADSLSAKHRVEDLAAFLACHDRLMRTRPLARDEAEALALHRRSVAGRYAHRRVLAEKAERGLFAALGWLALRPAAWSPVARGIGRDKLAGRRRPVWRKADHGAAEQRLTTLFDPPPTASRPSAPPGEAAVLYAGGPR